MRIEYAGNRPFELIALVRHYRGPSGRTLWLFRLRFDFGPQFSESPDCFGTGRKVDLGAAPVVYHAQKCLRDPHLKHAILWPFGGAAGGPFATSHFIHFVLTKRTTEGSY
jgi:hypothetical protein